MICKLCAKMECWAERWLRIGFARTTTRVRQEKERTQNNDTWERYTHRYATLAIHPIFTPYRRVFFLLEFSFSPWISKSEKPHNEAILTFLPYVPLAVSFNLIKKTQNSLLHEFLRYNRVLSSTNRVEFQTLLYLCRIVNIWEDRSSCFSNAKIKSSSQFIGI